MIALRYLYTMYIWSVIRSTRLACDDNDVSPARARTGDFYFSLI